MSWPCEFCTFVNPEDATNCRMCMKKKGTVAPISAEPQQSMWRCNGCNWLNPIENAICAACGNDKDTPSSIPAEPPLKAAAVQQDSNEWTCNLCTFINPSDASNCQSCGNNKGTPSPIPAEPQLKAAAAAADKLEKDRWECPRCTYNNAGHEQVCIMCDAPRDGKSSELKAASAESGKAVSEDLLESTSFQNGNYNTIEDENVERLLNTIFQSFKDGHNQTMHTMKTVNPKADPNDIYEAESPKYLYRISFKDDEMFVHISSMNAKHNDAKHKLNFTRNSNVTDVIKSIAKYKGGKKTRKSRKRLKAYKTRKSHKRLKAYKSRKPRCH